MTSPAALAKAIERELRLLGTPERAVKERAYLKSQLDHFGVPVPLLRRVVTKHAKPLDRAAALALAERLWARPVHELRAAAVEVLAQHRRTLEPGDMALLERMLREAKTWALVDALASAVAGALVERHPALGATLDRWAADGDFWIRRSAMLALLVPLRRGGGDFDRFARYADAMLDEKEFFIRKAIGWVLRDAGHKQPERVDAWIAPRTHRASGVTMREVVKALPAARRDALMAAYRDKRPAPRSTRPTTEPRAP